MTRTIFLVMWLVLIGVEVSAQDGGVVVLNAVGDVSLPGKAFVPVVERQGPKLFDGVRGVLDKGDLNFVNIETAITDAPPSAQKKFSFSMPPARMDWLVGAGFNLISLANNHITDAGDQGILDSIAAIESRSTAERPLVWSGVSLEAEKRYEPVFFERKGVTFAFFCVGFESGSHALEAGSPVHQVRDPRYREAIGAAREKADVVLISAHFGREYEHKPGQDALKLYRGFVDAGADLVIGHHPHVIRGVERYKSGVILHSLGNFSFASRTMRHQKSGAKMYSMIAQVEIDKGGIKSVRLHPLYVNNLESWTLGRRTQARTDFAPVPLKGDFARAVIEALDTWSAAIPGNKARVEVEGDVGVVRW